MMFHQIGHQFSRQNIVMKRAHRVVPCRRMKTSKKEKSKERKKYHWGEEEVLLKGRRMKADQCWGWWWWWKSEINGRANSLPRQPSPPQLLLPPDPLHRIIISNCQVPAMTTTITIHCLGFLMLLANTRQLTPQSQQALRHDGFRTRRRVHPFCTSEQFLWTRQMAWKVCLLMELTDDNNNEEE